VSIPILTISAVAFFLNSLILPKKPSSPVEFGLASHSSSCLRNSPQYQLKSGLNQDEHPDKRIGAPDGGRIRGGSKDEEMEDEAREEHVLGDQVARRIHMQSDQAVHKLLAAQTLEFVELRQRKLQRRRFLRAIKHFSAVPRLMMGRGRTTAGLSSTLTPFVSDEAKSFGMPSRIA